VRGDLERAAHRDAASRCPVVAWARLSNDSGIRTVTVAIALSLNVRIRAVPRASPWSGTT
jgi:hypothetical protein